MRKTVEHVFCDCCKKEIKDSFLEIEYKGAHLDYCEDCADKMIFGVTEKQATEKKPEQKAKTCCAPAQEHKEIVWDSTQKCIEEYHKQKIKEQEDQPEESEVGG
mgnify:CR=1 FL=1